MIDGTWTVRRRLALPRPRLRWLLSLRGLAALVVVALILGIGWLWFRGSSFVKIRQVTITGLSGPDVKGVRQALTRTAKSMTTLNLSVAKLDAAAAPYSDVRSLTVSTSFPHSVSIAVNEQVPVAEVTAGGRMTVIDSEGRLLTNATVSHGVLPSLKLAHVLDGDQVTAPGALGTLRVLAAAPYRFLAHIQTATSTSAHGVVLELRNGPDLYFGPASQLAEKWRSVISVLANSGSHGAQYIDVSDPRRPAAGVDETSAASAESDDDAAQ